MALKNVIKYLTRVLLIIVFLKPSASLAQEKPPPSTNIHLAALQGDIEAIRQHIEAGSDLNQRDMWGSVPLVIAVTFDKTEVSKALIEAGADIEIRDNNGSTPLHTAAFLCRTEIVQALLDKGADRYARNNFGNTPQESVAGPYGDVKAAYEQIGAGLAPLGLKLDYELIRSTRPKIVEMLRPPPGKLEAVDYAPLPGNDWKVSTPAGQGLDPMLVAELYYDASHLETVYGVLVIKNGYLIAEKYFNGASIDQKAMLQSVTKSYTSALIGIALKNGHLKSVDQKMVEFFPEFQGTTYDPRKDQITLRHMLQMRAGFPWEEMNPAHWDSLMTGDYVPMIVDFPLISDPGTGFNYSNLTSNWLGIIVARACGTDLKSFAQKHLFAPLGTEAGNWKQDRDGYYIGCADLELRARDMARFGLLFLHDGQFNGKQIVPSAWVKESLQNYSEDTWVTRDKVNRTGPYFRELGYGYQWWSAAIGGRRVNYASGHGGQKIILVHDLDMIVAVTADPFYLQHDDESWKHEKANVNLVGKFINSLPKE